MVFVKLLGVSTSLRGGTDLLREHRIPIDILKEDI